MRLLIVNADDWGLDVATTRAIAECFAAGRVTSATAMVHMADSDRAAALARAIGIPVGLHLNLSAPFTGDDVPAGVREAQARIATRFAARHRRWRRWVPDPTIRAQVDRCVRDQLARFEVLYGCPPTHVDGHHHVQVSPTVARTPALAGVLLRRALDAPADRAQLSAVARALRHRVVLADAGGTDRLLSLAAALAGEAPPWGADEAVEVMAHPGVAGDRALLRSDRWARVLADSRLGSYADLR